SFNATPTPHLSPLSLHDALPISRQGLPVPPPQTVLTLLDSGAAVTILDSSIVAALGLTTPASQITISAVGGPPILCPVFNVSITDRKSTRLNSSHLVISYAVFCL